MVEVMWVKILLEEVQEMNVKQNWDMGLVLEKECELELIDLEEVKFVKEKLWKELEKSLR